MQFLNINIQRFIEFFGSEDIGNDFLEGYCNLFQKWAMSIFIVLDVLVMC